MNGNANKKSWKYTLTDVAGKEKEMLAVLILLAIALVTFFANYFYLGKSIDESVFTAIVTVVGIIFCLSFIIPHISSELRHDDTDSAAEEVKEDECEDGNHLSVSELLCPEFFGKIKERLGSLESKDNK